MTDPGITPLTRMIPDTVNPPRLRKRGERFNDPIISKLVAQGRPEDARLYAGDEAVTDYFLRHPGETA